MDETPCYFDLPYNSTISKKGENTVSIATSGYEKLRFIVVLAATASGSRHKPMTFKNLKNISKLDKKKGLYFSFLVCVYLDRFLLLGYVKHFQGIGGLTIGLGNSVCAF